MKRFNRLSFAALLGALFHGTNTPTARVRPGLINGEPKKAYPRGRKMARRYRHRALGLRREKTARPVRRAHQPSWQRGWTFSVSK